MNFDRRPPRRPRPRRPSRAKALTPAITWVAERLDRRFGWDRLPVPLGVLTLIGLRARLRERNLYHSGLPAQAAEASPAGDRPLQRALDGSNTHPTCPHMGAAGTRFGRNAPAVTERDLANSMPPPKDLSAALLKRREFKPAPSLNLLAAAWLQFEVHDWFAHKVHNGVDGPLGLPPLKRDPERPGTLPVHLSDQTHWWDASQLYGANERFATAMRSDDFDVSGKVKIDDALLEAIAGFVDPDASVGGGDENDSNPVPNSWIGLALFHVVFAREHNAICDRLHSVYPRWTGQKLYDKARLINVAVMAKIHTVEWTAALIAHPTTVRAIRATWFGLLGERVRRRFGRIGASELLSGIPGAVMDDAVPYSITEDFVAVYRLHPLIPDEVTFHRVCDGARMDDLEGGATFGFEQLAVTDDAPNVARERLDAIEYENAWYSLAIAYPGSLTLHNHPTFERKLRSGEQLDLGAADILRARECAIPRYNEFRRSLHMKPADSFLTLAAGDEELAKEIEQAYGGDIEAVDMNVGVLADYKPAGFAISDTSFRIFLLMAARRLLSDRFFTMDYKPAVYTPLGLDWIENATMAGMLRRHYPALEPALWGVDNPFKPWPKVPAAP